MGYRRGSVRHSQAEYQRENGSNMPLRKYQALESSKVLNCLQTDLHGPQPLALCGLSVRSIRISNFRCRQGGFGRLLDELARIKGGVSPKVVLHRHR